MFSLTTDKLKYVSGETIHVSGCSDKNPTNIQIYDPSNQLFRSVVLQLRLNKFDYKFKLGNNCPTGSWKITNDNGDFVHKLHYSSSEYGDVVIRTPNASEVPFYAYPFKHTAKFTEQLCEIPSEKVTVTWINSDSDFHTATSFNQYTGELDNKFDTGFIPPGKNSSISVQMKNNEAIYYFCKLHYWEKGKLIRGETFWGEADLQQFDSVHQSVSEIERRKLWILIRHFDPSEIDFICFDDVNKIERRHITTVFWDIKKFSSTCVKLEPNPELLLEFMKEYFGSATRIIYKYGGQRDKFIGDGIMALFGTQRKEDDAAYAARNATLAALEFKNEFLRLKIKYCENWKKIVHDIEIDLKCGINTGPALSGNLGDLTNDQLTAVGNNVNLASRLCDLADGQQILISSTTKANIEPGFEIKFIGKKPIKNIGDYDVFEVTKMTEGPDYVKPFELGKGKIIDWNIPHQIIIGRPIEVYAKFLGSVEFGFFTFYITDSSGVTRYYEDKRSVDESLQIGKVQIKDDIYENKWKFSVENDLKPGKCKAEIGMYEDPNRHATQRHLVASVASDVFLV